MANFTGFIGTYTKGESEGIYTFSLDTEEARIQGVKLAASLDNPTYVTVSQDKQYLYSVVKEGEQGGAASFSIKNNGELEELNRELSPGASPCHISVDSKNKTVVTANYHRGTVEAYLTTSNGSLEPVSSIIQHEGSGPDKERQEKPHVHYAGFTPDEKYVAVVDLGIDQLITYEVVNGQLKLANKLSLKPGCGPRHLTFHPNGDYAYLMTEMSSEVVALQYNNMDGSFQIIQYISTLPSDFTENSQGSAIHISSDGHFVYAANRGHDSIAVYGVNQETGELTFIEHTLTEGNWPRDFVLDPTENYLIASNQNSSNLVLFKRDSATGKLTLLQSDIKVPDPVCVKFL
ncbi:lactonase family protein [Heyndrickxia oleronia]|uniref:6-phosphogluconolactonase n=1 Tax=Heyndrickxia oleronia TaxID=38875 RepID=A0A8E2I9S9_9BACI|nr:lactonase family protein [Heyndrickxia oleronia]MEC1373280.1 lactonase family protein [Heyndrickxia oleronia]OOP69356.1 6-phosphogluconolactonase [Heyndrickxia oleronia]QQZ04419.1 lactonase family protein [Heyndrickxia oleronia]